jgi:hypothetical protein
MPFTQGHALLIGVGSYRHQPQLNVPITAADAEAVAAVLREPAFCGSPESQVTLLRDATASRESIIAALDALAAQASGGDTVFLFFCGHGDYGDDGDYYLTTHDTRLQNCKVISGSGLRQSELIERLRAIKAKRLLLLVNACHSGELAPTLGPGHAPYTGMAVPAQTTAALLATGEGRVIITACREEQVSYIGNGTLTLFTQALVDGLHGHGTSSNRGYLSAFDLYTHLYFSVEGAVRQKYGVTQEPELTVLKGVGPFAVALYRGATALGEVEGTGAPLAGTALHEVNTAYSKAMFEQLAPGHYEQHIGGKAQIGGAVAGDVYGDISVDQHQETFQTQGFIHRPSGPVSQVFGEQREIDTGGGACAEGDIDQREGSFMEGDNISVGDITGVSGIAVGRNARAEIHRSAASKITNKRKIESAACKATCQKRK